MLRCARKHGRNVCVTSLCLLHRQNLKQFYICWPLTINVKGGVQCSFTASTMVLIFQFVYIFIYYRPYCAIFIFYRVCVCCICCAVGMYLCTLYAVLCIISSEMNIWISPLLCGFSATALLPPAPLQPLSVLKMYS